MPIIELRNIVKSFKTGEQVVPILKGIDLAIGEGEFVSIMGPSGSGKTTLASILGCLASPTSGSYLLAGHEVSRQSANQLADVRNKLIGYIFQDFNLLDGFSALDNVAMPLVYSGVGARQRRDRAAHLLNVVGLGARLDHMPNQLSGGQKQRVAIARALVNDPKLIFADEATGALDGKTSFEIMSLLQRLAMGGHTIVQVTHSERDSRFSKRILHIVDGLIVKDEFVEGFTVGVLPADRSSAEGSVGRLWRIVQNAPPPKPMPYAELKRLFDAGTSVDTQIEASRALIRFEDGRLNRYVLRLFQSEHWAVRAEVIKSCSATNQDMALGFFLAGLKDQNAWVRFLSISKLRELRPALAQVGEKLITNCLSDADERVRAATVSLVGQWGETRFLDALVERALCDAVPRVISNALEVLGKFVGDSVRGPALVTSLEPLLGHGHHRIRSTAAVVLHPYRRQSCADVIRGMLNSPSTHMRAAGAWALGVVGDNDAARSMLALLETEKEELVVNRLIHGLGKLSATALPIGEQVRLVLAGHAPQPDADHPPAPPLAEAPQEAS